MNPAALVGVGAAVGALLRYGTNQAVAARLGDRWFPYGTFTVNVVGSFVLGLVAFAGTAESVRYAVGTGACGAYTTFSTFSVDTVRLWEGGRHLLAAWYAAANLVGALVAIGAALGVTGVV